jgi:hypothetical protein
MKLRRNSVTGKIKTFKELDNIIHIKQITSDKNGKDMEINSICTKEQFNEVYKSICEKISNGENKSCSFSKFDTSKTKKTVNDITKIYDEYAEMLEKSEEREEMIDLYRSDKIQTYIDENKVYKDFFEINKEKIDNAKNFKDDFNKIIDILKKEKKIEGLSFKINMEQDNGKINFKVTQFKNNEKIREYDGGIKNINIKVKNNFKYSYEMQDEIKSYLSIDTGKTKCFMKDSTGLIDNLSMFLTTEDYVNTFSFEKTPDFKEQIYKKIDVVKQINDKLSVNLGEISKNEMWDETMSDIIANTIEDASLETNFKRKDYFYDLILDKTGEYFENRIINKDRIDFYMIERFEDDDRKIIDNLILEDFEFSSTGKIIKFDKNEDIYELYAKENGEFDEEKYKEVLREYLRGQFDEVYSELSDEMLNLKPNEFKELKETYLNLETGTIKKQKEFIENAFAIALKEDLPNLWKENVDGTKLNEEKIDIITYTSQYINSNNDFKEKLKGKLSDYDLSVRSFNKLIDNFNPNEYDFFVERNFDKYFSDELNIEKTKSNEKTKVKEKEIEIN